MSHSAAAAPERGFLRYVWFGLVAAGVLVFLLSFLGFWSANKAESPLHRAAETLYSSAQLLLLDNDARIDDWRLDAAKLLAPLVIGLTAILAILEVFQKSAAALLLKLGSGQVVICCLGPKGIHLIKEFRRLGKKVVAIEIDPRNTCIAPATEAGALVIFGDAADSLVLRKACVHRAEKFIAISGDDGTNMEIAVQVGHFVQNLRKRGAPPLQCFAQIVNLELRTHFRQQRLLAARQEGITVKIFNIFESSARVLMEKHPLDPLGFGASDPRTVHLIVIGFGQMGRAVTLQAAKIGHFANGKKLRVTVLDMEADKRKAKFYAHFPYFDEVCDVQFIQCDASSPEMMARMQGWTTEEESIPTFVVCFDDDTRSLSFSLSLKRKINSSVPICVRITSSRGFATLFADAGGNAALPDQLRPFGLVDHASTVEMVTGEKLDLIARTIHEDFVERRVREGQSRDANPALLPWDRLDEDFVDSNRQQADHIPVKLRAIRCFSSPAKGEKSVEFSKVEIDLLARMEHARWNAERRLAGWTYAPGKKDLARKTSPYIIGWEALTQEVQQYDIDTVMAIPKLLALAGERVCR